MQLRYVPKYYHHLFNMADEKSGIPIALYFLSKVALILLLDSFLFSQGFSSCTKTAVIDWRCFTVFVSIAILIT